MSDYISTYSGIHIVPSNPKPEDFRIRDIAHALSLICRGNGHVKTFWSVGEHCIACAKEAVARGLPVRIVLACLLHDAGECYLSDVPRPIKQTMTSYLETENRLLSMIYRKFLGSDLTNEESAVVKEIDDDLLWYDLTELLDEPLSGSAPGLHIDLSYAVRPFSEVEAEYLGLYDRYAGNRQPYKKMIYIAGPFFNEAEIKNIEYVEQILTEKGISFFSPMRHEEKDEVPGTPAWAGKLFETDRRAIDNCDAVLTLYYGNYSDTGTAWECGYAYAKGKPVILVHAGGEDSNLMMHCGCRTNISLQELADFDFETMPVYEYQGKMF